MKVRLAIAKGGTLLHDEIYEIDDAASFGAAWADVWVRVRERCMTEATSIGSLVDTLQENVLDALDGSTLTTTKL